MKRTQVVNFRLTEEELQDLQRAANRLTDGNLSELLRRYVLGTQRDYRLLTATGILQLVLFFRDLSPKWRSYRYRHPA